LDGGNLHPGRSGQESFCNIGSTSMIAGEFTG
jgi:hypothetical protein